MSTLDNSTFTFPATIVADDTFVFTWASYSDGTIHPTVTVGYLADHTATFTPVIEVLVEPDHSLSLYLVGPHGPHGPHRRIGNTGTESMRNYACDVVEVRLGIRPSDAEGSTYLDTEVSVNKHVVLQTRKAVTISAVPVGATWYARVDGATEDPPSASHEVSGPVRVPFTDHADHAAHTDTPKLPLLPHGLLALGFSGFGSPGVNQ